MMIMRPPQRFHKLRRRRNGKQLAGAGNMSNLRISLPSDAISNGFCRHIHPVSGWSFPIAAFSAKRTASPPPQSTPGSASLSASWSTPLKRGRQRYTVYPCRVRIWMRICPPDGRGRP
jgi:hypothetical protein